MKILQEIFDFFKDYLAPFMSQALCIEAESMKLYEENIINNILCTNVSEDDRIMTIQQHYEGKINHRGIVDILQTVQKDSVPGHNVTIIAKETMIFLKI